MLRLDRLSKDFREAGALNQQINLYGFIDEHTFLTKTGDVGVLLEVQGLDYESLDSASVDTYTKRLESAMRLFDDRCRLYQYLFKRNRQTIPHETYENAVVNAAIQTRIGYLESQADHLYSLTIYYAILFEGFRYHRKYLHSPVQAPARRPRSSKLDPFKSAVAGLLEQDPSASAVVILPRLRPVGYEGGITLLRAYVSQLRTPVHPRRAFVRMEPAPGERFEID